MDDKHPLIGSEFPKILLGLSHSFGQWYGQFLQTSQTSWASQSHMWAPWLQVLIPMFSTIQKLLNFMMGERRLHYQPFHCLSSEPKKVGMEFKIFYDVPPCHSIKLVATPNLLWARNLLYHVGQYKMSGSNESIKLNLTWCVHGHPTCAHPIHIKT